MKNDDLKRPKFTKVSDYVFEIPKSYVKGMLVPARVYADKRLLDQMDTRVFEQIANVSSLPGIQEHSLVMPDGHSGYGFPIGGVAAFDPEDGGVISPGGIGFDINCGMRLILTNLKVNDIKNKIKELVDGLFSAIPTGVGNSSRLNINREEFRKLAENGSRWAVEKGWGYEEDLKGTELNGFADWADVSKISEKAISRGLKQIGTLGSGNHYLEIQQVKKENIEDEKIAEKWGIFPDQIVIMLHTGSRGAGHQIATDYVQRFSALSESKNGIKVNDKELVCAPFLSDEGQDYYKAMGCGVNIALANRQAITHAVRQVFSKVLKRSPDKLGMELLFDVAHNRASLERHSIGKSEKELLIHRKGSTGSYAPGRKEIPRKFRKDGSPVIIGGSMETGSYLLVGSAGSEDTFSSTCHGSGRTKSRSQARKSTDGEKLFNDMLKKGVYVKSASWAGLAEESGDSYKDIDSVVDVIHSAGISKKVCKLLPLGNIKG